MDYPNQGPTSSAFTLPSSGEAVNKFSESYVPICPEPVPQYRKEEESEVKKFFTKLKIKFGLAADPAEYETVTEFDTVETNWDQIIARSYTAEKMQNLIAQDLANALMKGGRPL